MQSLSKGSESAVGLKPAAYIIMKKTKKVEIFKKLCDLSLVVLVLLFLGFCLGFEQNLITLKAVVLINLLICVLIYLVNRLWKRLDQSSEQD